VPPRLSDAEKGKIRSGLEGQCRALTAEYQHLRAIADQLAPNPWCRRIRDPEMHKDRQALEELARRPEIASLPPSTAILLARVLSHKGAMTTAVNVLYAIQQRSPNDLLGNHELAVRLSRMGPTRIEEAIGFLRAEVALRPDTRLLHTKLGDL